MLSYSNQQANACDICSLLELDRAEFSSFSSQSVCPSQCRLTQSLRPLQRNRASKASSHFTLGVTEITNVQKAEVIGKPWETDRLFEMPHIHESYHGPIFTIHWRLRKPMTSLLFSGLILIYVKILACYVQNCIENKTCSFLKTCYFYANFPEVRQK